MGFLASATMAVRTVAGDIVVDEATWRPEEALPPRTRPRGRPWGISLWTRLPGEHDRRGGRGRCRLGQTMAAELEENSRTVLPRGREKEQVRPLQTRVRGGRGVIVFVEKSKFRADSCWG